jgi:hypothetical protein
LLPNPPAGLRDCRIGAKEPADRKGAYQEVLQKLVEIFLDDFDENWFVVGGGDGELTTGGGGCDAEWPR